MCLTSVIGLRRSAAIVFQAELHLLLWLIE